MNKQQIIAPLVAMALCVIIFGLVIFPNLPRHPEQKLLATASLVGRDLVSKTNSDLLTSIGPALKSDLNDFLGAPVKRTFVRNTVSDQGKPTALVTLVNDSERLLLITLRWESKLAKFEIVSYGDYPALAALTNPPSASKK
jgi:hypothetical protein